MRHLRPIAAGQRRVSARVGGTLSDTTVCRVTGAEAGRRGGGRGLIGRLREGGRLPTHIGDCDAWAPR